VFHENIERGEMGETEKPTFDEMEYMEEMKARRSRPLRLRLVELGQNEGDQACQKTRGLNK